MSKDHIPPLPDRTLHNGLPNQQQTITTNHLAINAQQNQSSNLRLNMPLTPVSTQHTSQHTSQISQLLQQNSMVTTQHNTPVLTMQQSITVENINSPSQSINDNEHRVTNLFHRPNTPEQAILESQTTPQQSTLDAIHRTSASQQLVIVGYGSDNNEITMNNDINDDNNIATEQISNDNNINTNAENNDSNNNDATITGITSETNNPFCCNCIIL